MSNWALPTEASQYLDVLAQLKERDADSATLFLDPPTNPVTGSIRFVRGASFTLQEYDGSVWQNRLLGVASGGTGSTTLEDVKASLNLGSISNQNYDAVNITGGVIGGMTSVNARLFTLGDAAPAFVLTATGGAVNTRRWVWHTGGYYLNLDIQNDDATGGANFLSFIRTANVPNYLQVNAEMLVKVNRYDTTGQAMPLQVGGGVLMVHSLTNLAFNLYTDAGGWKYAAGGMAGWIIHRNNIDANLHFYGTPINSGGAGATAPISQTMYMTPTGDMNIFGSLTVQNITTTGSINAASWINTSTYLIAHTTPSLAGVIIDGRNDNWSMLQFRGYNGDNFTQIRSPNNAHLDFLIMRTGLTYTMTTGAFYPSAPDAITCGGAGNRWLWVFSVYHNSPTGYGFIFDQNGGRGMLRNSGGLLLADDAALNFQGGGVLSFKISVNGTFGVWVLSANSLTPMSNDGHYVGYNAPIRWYAVFAAVGTIQASDSKLKNIEGPETLGLKFINRLEPTQYRFKKPHPLGKKNRMRHGLVAQKVEQLLKELDVEFDGLITPDNPEEDYCISYTEFIGPIIKAIQELDAKVESLRK